MQYASPYSPVNTLTSLKPHLPLLDRPAWGEVQHCSRVSRGYSDLYEEVSRLDGLGEGEVDLLAEAGGALPLHHHLGGTLQAAAASNEESHGHN